MSENNEAQFQEDEKALKSFLIDPNLRRLDEKSRKFNLFDVLKISRTEIRHSNILAWLIDPHENHGLGDTILRGIIAATADNAQEINVVKALLMDTDDFVIYREWNHIDILAVSEKSNFVFCMENKVMASEHDNQLGRYFDIIKVAYPQHKQLFILLSPDGAEAEKPEDQENWQALSYSDVVDIIQSAKESISISSEAGFVIEQYCDAVRRYIVGDKEVEKLCNEIYKKHKRAIDLIIENKYDATAQISEIVQDWCKKMSKQGYLAQSEQHGKFVRFTTPYMDGIFQPLQAPNGCWGDTSIYVYEMAIRNESIRTSLILCNDHLSPEQRAACERAILNYKPKKLTKWKRLIWLKNFSVKYRIKDSERDVGYIDEEEKKEILKTLNKLWEEIRDFEKEFKNKWENAE